ncbi:hypothetical protein E2R60_00775 [Paenibacillus dendritiformis]|uniref:mandelate racemase/muconate lactonizing enzyme family protein n=1 Tax=Paenibacillus dendritiformis TaxID=130049 RepID=UPI001059E419|nr:enolase C-terminal domain-like protein [Paenibacillus dendritiformis]TDL57095.1 hypothetical protein E2R60_00775 [Paenibacillus dendritiformis]
MRIWIAEMNIELNKSFTSNKGTIHSIRQFVIGLSANKKIGYGTMIAEIGVSTEEVKANLRRCSTILKDVELFDLDSMLLVIGTYLSDYPKILSALDMALHDLSGKLKNESVGLMWGVSNLSRPQTSITIGAKNGEELLHRASYLTDWPILKLKMTSMSDPMIIEHLRQIYTGRIWIDGNEAWDVEEAVENAQLFSNYGVELLEQPIRAGSLDKLRVVRQRSPIPIVADEDFSKIEDLVALRGCADVINIKLLKCGGLRKAKEIIQAARLLGFKVMLGCKTESTLGVTAMSHLAGGADYLDLDGHLSIKTDPFSGLTIQKGDLIIPDGAGLGVTLSHAVSMDSLLRENIE